MKQLFLILLTAVIVYPISFFMPWWFGGIACFIICYILKPGFFTAFATSFITLFLIWYFQAYISDRHFDQPVSHLLGKLMGDITPNSIFWLTGFIGGFTAGLAGLTGHWTRKLVAK
ncbi:MAG TPA: hypothetical protein PK611_09035 [Saprospiraceae bacterium]|jgi:ABC-type multidrug transport system permease subunit|nr:hypothetical protein [Saprospiraceae bacterium]HRO08668.1 hypothetical protein [Saprospiraceae bacterium]HRO73802.1 hypothetical protein [Saprospiraceae bacterium]HRP42744.1 hypothetical protein [Saprospiraceae bacterium]